MKLSRICIDRFETRSNLQLDSLSPELNAIYGPNGSGKSTLIQFIRWIIYGSVADSSVHQVHPHHMGSQGTLVVRDQQGQAFTLRRAEDGTTSGALSVSDNLGIHSLRANQLDDLRPISSIEFDTFFHVEMSEDQPLVRLIRSTSDQGLILTENDASRRELQTLTDRLRDLRSLRSRLPGGKHTRRQLDERRIAVSRKLDEITESIRCQRESHESQLRSLYAELTERRRQLDGYGELLRRIDERVQSRQRDCEDQLKWAESIKSEEVSRRRKQIETLELQIARFKEMLGAIRHRLNSLGSYSSNGKDGVHPHESPDMHEFLLRIGLQIDTADSDLVEIDHELGLELEGIDDCSVEWRSHLDAGLKAVREDVAQLRQQFDSRHHDLELTDHHREREQLTNCETELCEFVESLSQRRDSLTAAADPYLVRKTLPYRPSSETSTGSYPSLSNWDDGTGSDHQWPMLGHRVAHIRLQYVLQRRDMLRLRRNDLASEVGALEQRLHELELLRNRSYSRATYEATRCESERIATEIRSLEERDRLRDQIADLEEQLHVLRNRLEPSPILRRASDYLSRLTLGSLTKICIGNNGQVNVEDRSGQSWHVENIGRGGRDQARLSLCLAIVYEYRNRGLEMPVILNDVFANLDHEAASAAVNLIMQMTQEGFQVLVFTRHEHVHRLLLEHNAKSYTLVNRSLPSMEREPRFVPALPPQPIRRPEPSRPAAPVRIAAATPHVEKKPTWIAEWRDRPPQDQFNRAATSNELLAPSHGQVDESATPSPRLQREQESSYPLSDQSPIEALRSIDVDSHRLLRDIGFETVGQLLEPSVDELHERLVSLRLDRETAARWRAQALLERHAELTGFEARLLVAAGYTDPSLIAGEEPNEILHRIDQVLNRTASDRQYGTSRDYDQNAAQRWIRSARESNWRVYTSENEPAASTDPNARHSASAPSQPDRRTVRMSPSAALRFYLELSDPVVDAPSIGPKTAAQLKTLGISTVSDLLKGNAKRIAEQLELRRVTEDVVRQWQIQAELVFRIPNLRGHDAQILEACGISQPNDLAARDADTLYEQVAAFVDTNDGRRILRSGKKPDLREVTSWIEWARSARTLRAA